MKTLFIIAITFVVTLLIVFILNACRNLNKPCNESEYDKSFRGTIIKVFPTLLLLKQFKEDNKHLEIVKCKYIKEQEKTIIMAEFRTK